MSLLKQNFLSKCKEELIKTNLIKLESSSTILTLLDQIWDDCNGNPIAINSMLNNIIRLSNGLPLSEINEEELIHNEDGSVTHPRYEYIQKLPNGTYIDQRAIAFLEPNGNKWYGTNGKFRSGQVINFPYYPNEKIVYMQFINLYDKE